MNILILINKDFEYGGYSDGVEHQISVGKAPHLHQLFRDRNVAYDKYEPSCIYELHAVNKVHNIREYCINYLFNEKEDSSCSENKYRLVKKLFLKLKEENNLPDYIFR